MKCTKCQKELRIAPEKVGVGQNGMPILHRFGYCDYCRLKWDLEQQFYMPFYQNAKKRNSTLSCVSCVFAGVAFIFPMIIFIGYILSLTGAVIGLVDLCVNKKYEKHIGSWFALIVFVIYNIFVFVLR